MRFQAAIFDLDGTLVNSLADLGESMNLALRLLGLPEHQADAYRYFVGEGIRVMAGRALPADNRDEATIDRCTDLTIEEYSRRLTAKTRPYDGIPQLLDGLSAAGLGLAILSNKQDAPTKAIAAELLSSWRFAQILGSRPPVPKKPDPAAALEIAAAMGLPPSAFLYLGDTAIDMRTAAAAGMFGIGVLWGFRSAEELIQGGAKVLLAHPVDLLAFF